MKEVARLGAALHAKARERATRVEVFFERRKHCGYVAQHKREPGYVSKERGDPVRAIAMSMMD